MRTFRIFVCAKRQKIGSIFQNTQEAKRIFEDAKRDFGFGLAKLNPPIPVLLMSNHYSYREAEAFLFPEMLNTETWAGVARRLPNGRGFRVVATAKVKDILNLPDELADLHQAAREGDIMRVLDKISRHSYYGKEGPKRNRSILFGDFAGDAINRLPKDVRQVAGRMVMLSEDFFGARRKPRDVNVDLDKFAKQADGSWVGNSWVGKIPAFPTAEQYAMAKAGINPHHPMLDLMFMYPETIDPLKIIPETIYSEMKHKLTAELGVSPEAIKLVEDDGYKSPVSKFLKQWSDEARKSLKHTRWPTVAEMVQNLIELTGKPEAEIQEAFIKLAGKPFDEIKDFPIKWELKLEDESPAAVHDYSIEFSRVDGVNNEKEMPPNGNAS